MDPIIGSTLLKVGGSLLGGLFGRKKQVSAQQNSRQAILGQAQGAREAAEQFGFNPLTLLGVSSAVGPSSSENFMGNAIADASLFAAEGMEKKNEREGKLADAQRENEALKKKLTNATIRPKVGGIYARNETVLDLGEDEPVGDRRTYAPPPKGITVWNALNGRRMTIDRRVAGRLRLGQGDAWIAEDNEAVLGDVLSEGVSLGSAAAGTVTGNHAPFILDEQAPYRSEPTKRPPLKGKDRYSPINRFLNSYGF